MTQQVVSQYRQGTSTITTTCAYCGVGCGIDISIENTSQTAKVSALTGCEDHPANFGRLCVKGSNLLTAQAPDKRLTSAYIGENCVTVDEATSYVARQFNHLIEIYGPESVAFYVSGQLLTEDYYVANKLMKGYIGTGNIDTNSRLCMSSAVAAYKRAFGEDIVPCSYQDIEHCDLFILTGSNMAWTHPVLFQRLSRAKDKNPNLTILCLDPRSTATSDFADFHLPLKPGSDAAFFNGLLHYLVEQEEIDQDFISAHCDNADHAIASAEGWTIEQVARFCDLSIQAVKKAYELFVEKKNVVSFFSMGVNQSNSGVDKCNAIINCHLASGKIGKLGNGPFSITGQPNAMGGREVGGLANQLTAHLDINNEEHQTLVQTFWQSPTMAKKAGKNAMDMFDEIASGKIKAVWIIATNPAVSLPDHENIKAALNTCELVVVSDCAASNDTLAFADVKLPSSGWLEKNGTVTNSERRISRQRGIVEPPGNAKHDWQLICDVASKMGFDGFNYSHPYEIFTELARLSGFKNKGDRAFDISGLAELDRVSYDNLQPIQWPVNQAFPTGCQHIFAKRRFYTATGRANLVPVIPSLPALNHLEKSVENEFLVNSGRIRDQWHTMTRTGNSAKLFTTQVSPSVLINPMSASKLNIADNDYLKVTSKTGSVVLPAKLDDSVQPTHLFVPIHWNKQFASDASVSALYANIVDPISGQPQLKQTIASIEKLTFKQHFTLFSQSDVALKTDYWHKYLSTSFTITEGANIEEDQLISQLIKQQIKGQWYSYTNPNQSFYVCLANDQLVAYLSVSQHQHEANTAWLESLANKRLDFTDIKSLLAGDPSDEFKLGKIVCSCFEVREKTIESAIADGADSVSALSTKLKCGTSCGSCKPELQQYVNKYADKVIETTKIA